jgi:hypothetical protein
MQLAAELVELVLQYAEIEVQSRLKAKDRKITA